MIYNFIGKFGYLLYPLQICHVPLTSTELGNVYFIIRIKYHMLDSKA